MKVIFLGVGEAFDKDLPNNSHIIQTDKVNILLDCGYNMPQQLWKFSEDPNLLDAINISHHHADHSFGLPAILMRMWEGGREKEITIFGFAGLKDYMEFAYKDFQKKFKFKINIVETKEGKDINFMDVKMSYQKTIHSGENLAIRIDDGKNVIGYSGDGSPISDTDFYNNLDLLILETYMYDKEIIGHSSILSGIKFAEENNVKCLALTHLNRDFRKNDLSGIREKIKSDKISVIIPEPLQEYNI